MDIAWSGGGLLCVILQGTLHLQDASSSHTVVGTPAIFLDRIQNRVGEWDPIPNMLPHSPARMS